MSFLKGTFLAQTDTHKLGFKAGEELIHIVQIVNSTDLLMNDNDYLLACRWKSNHCLMHQRLFNTY